MCIKNLSVAKAIWKTFYFGGQMIEVTNVSRDFGTFRAVNDVSFSIPTGQIVGLLGPDQQFDLSE